MKNIILGICIVSIPFLSSIQCHGQIKVMTKPPFTLNASSKTSYQASPYILDWSLGETISINTLYSSQNWMITTGVLQNEIVHYFSLDQIDSFGNQIYVGPIPVKESLHVWTNQNNITIQKMIISDQWGRIQIKVEGPFSGLYFNQQIPFTSANTGIYFLMIYYVAGQSMTRIKICKVIKM
ncbi:MAG: hypothetical protein RIR64_512 [Bacteroidota bacterium]|jgi:hypothetical protein